MPWVLLVLYGSGLAMAWRYCDVLAHPLDSSFALMLSISATWSASCCSPS
ncbi:hypothetical protein [Luteimonas arsenica]|nr:hypothetical protein [Luteimonas arsenica]